MNAKHASHKTLLITTGLALAMVVTISSQSNARMWGNNYGPMMGRGMTNGTMMNGGMMGGTGYNMPALTAEQQTAMNDIEEKYETQLTDKETDIRNKTTELRTAQANDETTFGDIKTLRSELYTLEQDYWTLRNTVNQKISSTVGTSFYGNMGWGPNNCTWHDDHQGMYYGTSYMYNQRGPMMGNGSNWCNW